VIRSGVDLFVGRQIAQATIVKPEARLGPRTATIVGVLEPAVPYPANTPQPICCSRRSVVRRR
jgi:hypothetical protein